MPTTRNAALSRPGPISLDEGTAEPVEGWQGLDSFRAFFTWSLRFLSALLGGLTSVRQPRARLGKGIENGERIPMRFGFHERHV